MSRFLAVFTGSAAKAADWMKLDDAMRMEITRKGIAAWKKWAEDHAGRIVEMGGPLSKTKLVDAKAVSDIRNAMSAFTIVEAPTFEEAARLFLDHPHFAIFPGDGVEVMEIMPIPNMD